jgi:hypothetical protein
MRLSREDQIEFAKEILALTNNETANAEQLVHLKKLVSLLHRWTNGRSGIVGYLDEYVYELVAVARGEEDTGWKDEFKKNLLKEISDL